MNINAHTEVNLVIGSPIRHSQSPAFHQALYQSLGINAVMIAVENPGLAEIISSIKTLPVRLTAVTLPYKTEILDYVDELSPEVEFLRAANTLILKNGKITAHNTDVFGIEAALAGVQLKGKKVLILGAGGSARALGFVLSRKEGELFWLNRSVGKAQELANLFGGKVVREDQVNSLPFDIIINCTPVGMSSDSVIASPVLGAKQSRKNSSWIALSEYLLAMTDLSPLRNYKFNPNQTVFDLVYTPEITPLLEEAKQAGAQIISGLEMFKAQAKQQIALAYEVIS